MTDPWGDALDTACDAMDDRYCVGHKCVERGTDNDKNKPLCCLDTLRTTIEKLTAEPMTSERLRSLARGATGITRDELIGLATGNYLPNPLSATDALMSRLAARILSHEAAPDPEEVMLLRSEHEAYGANLEALEAVCRATRDEVPEAVQRNREANARFIAAHDAVTTWQEAHR